MSAIGANLAASESLQTIFDANLGRDYTKISIFFLGLDHLGFDESWLDAQQVDLGTLLCQLAVPVGHGLRQILYENFGSMISYTRHFNRHVCSDA